MCDALYCFILYKVGNVLYKTGFVYHVGKLGCDNAETAVVKLLNLRLCTDLKVPLTRRICSPDACHAHNNTCGRKIRTLDMLHKVSKRCFGVVYNLNNCVDDLAEVVRRNICRHTDGNTVASVD